MVDHVLLTLSAYAEHCIGRYLAKFCVAKAQANKIQGTVNKLRMLIKPLAHLTNQSNARASNRDVNLIRQVEYGLHHLHYTLLITLS